MDRIDKRILAQLQEDSTLSLAQLAQRVGLSTTPCWRRVQKLERDGIIKARVTLLDRDHLNLGVDVFVAIKTNQHTAQWLEKFARVVAEFPEVVEFYRMSGDIDYLMRVVVPDIAAYDSFYRRLIREVDITDVSSSFAMERLKYTTALPLDYAQ
ncbi:MAG: Lrp/AsnC family transcriptional regulator [Gammaproteobacteria bacterium]|jgi:Lrp/AsnC family transcriptional regulator